MAILPKLFGKKLETPVMPAQQPPQVRDGRSASDIEELREDLKNRQVSYKLANENNPLFGKEKGHSLEVDEGAIAAKKAAAIVRSEDNNALLAMKDNDALMVATWENNLEGMESAINQGADLNIRDFLGKSPLHYVSSLDAAKLLIDGGADINILDNNNRTPLFEVDDPNIAIFLIDRGASINLKDKDSFTPLHLWVNHPKVAKHLLVAGANPNAQLSRGGTLSRGGLYKKGNSTLHCANNLESAKILIEYGVDITIKNKYGLLAEETALDETREVGLADYIKSFRIN
ncbi:MAG: ankyrin repeat domain-containing protein [Candidatus Nitrotoga sp.]